MLEPCLIYSQFFLNLCLMILLYFFQVRVHQYKAYPQLEPRAFSGHAVVGVLGAHLSAVLSDGIIRSSIVILLMCTILRNST